MLFHLADDSDQNLVGKRVLREAVDPRAGSVEKLFHSGLEFLPPARVGRYAFVQMHRITVRLVI